MSSAHLHCLAHLESDVSWWDGTLDHLAFSIANVQAGGGVGVVHLFTARGV